MLGLSRRAACLAALLLAALAVPARGGVVLSPQAPTAADWIRVHVSGFGCASPSLPVTVTVAGHVEVTDGILCIVQPMAPFEATYTIGRLPAGDYSLEVLVGGSGSTTAFTVRERRTSVLLATGRFQVSLEFTDPRTGAVVPAPAGALSDDSGYFSFFDADNVEVTVKILDGRPVNGHFWVFVASMTDVAFTLRIDDGRLDCQLGGTDASCVRMYRTLAGQNRNFVDLNGLAP